MKVLCPTAYKEGWATYAEHYAANLYGETDSKENLIMRYRVKKVLAQGYLRVLVDMKVNYDGVSANAIETWLTDTVKLNEHAYFLNSSAQDPSDSKNSFTRKARFPTSRQTFISTRLCNPQTPRPITTATFRLPTS